jgi:hypothetical protein
MSTTAGAWPRPELYHHRSLTRPGEAAAENDRVLRRVGVVLRKGGGDRGRRRGEGRAAAKFACGGAWVSLSLACRRARRGEEEGAGARCLFLGTDGASCLCRLGHRWRKLPLPSGAPTARAASERRRDPGRGWGCQREVPFPGRELPRPAGAPTASSSGGRWRLEEEMRERQRWGKWEEKEVGCGGLGGRRVPEQCFAGSTRPSSVAKLDLSFPTGPGWEGIFAWGRQCWDRPSRSNKQHIVGWARLRWEFLSSAGLPNTPSVAVPRGGGWIRSDRSGRAGCEPVMFWVCRKTCQLGQLSFSTWSLLTCLYGLLLLLWYIWYGDYVRPENKWLSFRYGYIQTYFNAQIYL